jgi:hypothetical protein
MAQVRLASHIRGVNFSDNEYTGFIRYPNMARRAVRTAKPVRRESSAGTLLQGFCNFTVGMFGRLIVRQCIDSPDCRRQPADQRDLQQQANDTCNGATNSEKKPATAE